MPGVFDGVSAHLARRAGFDAVYATGAGIAASGFGLPNIGLVTATEIGIGSSRPVAALVRHLGVAALVAEEFNSLFLRGAINNGLPALAVPGVRDLVAEGEPLTIHLALGWARGPGGRRVGVAPLPEMVLDILDAGGLLPRLVADDHLRR